MSGQFAEGSLGAALEQEHREIDGGIEAYVASLAQPVPDHQPLLKAHQALRRHIYLEEEFLFPGLTGDPSLPMAMFVMYREHGEIWSVMDELAELLNQGEPVVIKKACHDLLALLEKHNFKEEPVIYSKADNILSGQLSAEIREFLAAGEMPPGWTCRKFSKLAGS